MSHDPIQVGILLPTRDAVMSGRFEAAGVPFAQRVGRLGETLTICRQLWAEGMARQAGRP